MNLFSEFSRKAPNRVFISILLGALSGISYALLIPLILNVLKEGDPRLTEISSGGPVRLFGLDVANAPFAMIYLGACLFILFGRTLSQVLLTRVAIDVSSQLRTRLYEQIANAPVAALERIGSARLVAALTTDVPRIVIGARVFPDLLINLVTLVGMLGFLLVLNPDVFWFVLGCIAFGIVSYQIPMFVGRRYFIRARQSFDGLQESIQGLIHGIKELKLSDAKREAYFRSVLMSFENDVRDYEKTGHTVVRIANNYGDLLGFFVIGSIIFIFVNYRLISNLELIGVVMALLYLTGPVAIILGFIPQIAVSRVSMNRVTRLLDEMPSEGVSEQRSDGLVWDQVRFDRVIYRYSENGNDFQVGPLDLQFRKGEVTFIVGGNGSGKSTLGKLLTLHYRPASGTISFGDHAITDESIGSFRQSVSAIYSDYYLFDKILGVEDEKLGEMVDHYLKALRLDGKVAYRDGKFTTLALSDGQRRRMALLISMIDDKELYLFDEWAADQDPAFKIVFYNEILPVLKAKGKAIVAITHDDRYFGLADQIVVLGEGQVLRVERKNSAPSLPDATTSASAESDKTPTDVVDPENTIGQ
jgi:putative ATP-binding cassette transporter